MTFIQSIFRYVFVACIAMILYCAYNMHRVDVPCSPDDMNGYLFFQFRRDSFLYNHQRRKLMEALNTYTIYVNGVRVGYELAHSKYHAIDKAYQSLNCEVDRQNFKAVRN